MTDQHNLPTTTDRKPSPPERVTGKVMAAIEAMVWQGLPRSEAAAKARISEHGLYKALRKPPVKAALLREMEVLRTSERPRNIRRLAEIREAADNMPAIQAIRMLEQLSEDTPARSAGSVSLPGLVINIINAPAEPPTIDVSHTDVTHD